MSDHRTHLDSIEQPTVHHEETDINIRAVFGSGAALLVVALAVFLAVWGLFTYFDSRAARDYGPASPLATGEARLPPEPRLQVNPREDAAEFHAQEDAILDGYTWVNREAGTVRIPIAEAMKATVQKGLPVRRSSGEQQK